LRAQHGLDLAGVALFQRFADAEDRFQADLVRLVRLLVKERIVEVSWADQARGVFMVQIQVEALDRSGLLSDVTRVLTESHVNILSASVSTGRDRVAISKFVFEMADPSHLDHLLNQVRRIDNVYDVYRVKSA